jgi:antitoxin ParD1/3/4
MDVSLTPELEQLVTAKVASGRYPSASDMICEGLRLLQERDELGEEQLEELRSEIRLGLAQLDRGEATDYDDASLKELFERIKRRGREKLEKESGRTRIHWRSFAS